MQTDKYEQLEIFTLSREEAYIYIYIYIYIKRERVTETETEKETEIERRGREKVVNRFRSIGI